MTKMIKNLKHNDLIQAAIIVADDIMNRYDVTHRTLHIFPVPRGGVPVTYLTMAFLKGNIKLVDNVLEADVIIDDIVDSGATRDKLLELNPNARFYALFENPSMWLSFPYERTLDGEDKSIEDAILRLAQYHKIPETHFEKFSNILKKKPSFNL
jgi:hypothetical protein